MPTTRVHKQSTNGRQALIRRNWRLRLPIVGITLDVPRDMLPFYGALAATAALDFIEWPVAIVVGIGHYVADRSGNRAMQELGAGMKAGN